MTCKIDLLEIELFDHSTVQKKNDRYLIELLVITILRTI